MTGRKATFLEYFYPNPLEFAKNARNYECPKGNAIGFLCIIRQEKKMMIIDYGGVCKQRIIGRLEVCCIAEKEKRVIENLVAIIQTQ